MVSHEVEISRAAERQLRKLSREDQERVSRAMLALADDPLPQGCEEARRIRRRLPGTRGAISDSLQRLGEQADCRRPQAGTPQGRVSIACPEVAAARRLSAAKWGAFEVTGNEAFKARCARLAAEHGFQITNPELQESIARERERLRVDVEPTPELDVVPEATPVRIPATEESPVRTREVEPEIAEIAAVFGNARERGPGAKWDLVVPESWDDDVDRPRDYLLYEAGGEISLQGVEPTLVSPAAKFVRCRESTPAESSASRYRSVV